MQNFNFSAWSEQGNTGNPDECRTSRAIIGCVLVLLILWTLLGNLTVCAAVIRYSHLRGKVTNIFIVSLALSDLLVGVLVMPWKATTEVAGFWPFGAFCDTWVACDIMCSTASILNLCVISVDRYWAISSPFIYERTMNRTVAFVMIGVTWSLSAVISFVPVQLNWHRASTSDLTNEPEYKLMHPNRTIAAGENCDSSLNRTYAISSSLISFYIPVAIMIVVYTRIYRIAQVQISKISSLERAAEHAQSCRSGAHDQGLSMYHAHSLQPDQPLPQNHQSHRALKLSFKKETKVLKTLSIIMGVFVCCWFPFFVLNCVMPFCSGPEYSDKQGPYCVSEKTFDVFVWFGWSNSSLNPIIYAFNAEFRDAFLRLLGCRGGYCCVTVSTPMETAVFSNEARSLKHDSSLNAETGIACTVSRSARGSGDSVNTMIIPLFFHITTSDTEEYMHVVTQSTL